VTSRRPDLIVRGKLTAPVPPARLVGRERIARLLGLQGFPPVVIVCAPAGFGKTTLAMQWLDQRGVQPAWYALAFSASPQASLRSCWTR
jgi:LuxR family maltose regulon positive regulatory protein